MISYINEDVQSLIPQCANDLYCQYNIRGVVYYDLSAMKAGEKSDKYTIDLKVTQFQEKIMHKIRHASQVDRARFLMVLKDENHPHTVYSIAKYLGRIPCDDGKVYVIFKPEIGTAIKVNNPTN